MIRNARTAVKFFVYGIIVGLMFAPQDGAETRKKVLGWVGGTLQETFGVITGGASGSGNDKA